MDRNECSHFFQIKLTTQATFQGHKQTANAVRMEAVKRKRGRPPKVKVNLPGSQAETADVTMMVATGEVKRKQGRPPKVKVSDSDASFIGPDTQEKVKQPKQSPHRDSGVVLDSMSRSNSDHTLSCMKKIDPRVQSTIAVLTSKVTRKNKSGRDSVYSCDICETMFNLKGDLAKHVASQHPEVKPYQCLQCEYRCRYSADLNHHERMKHVENPKMWPCPEPGCEFQTKWRRNLSLHQARHTDLRPFKCDLCDFRFKRKFDIAKHMIWHSTDKPLKCDHEGCEFRCKTNYELNQHKLKHSSDKPFSCPICDRRTKTKSDLTKHIHTHSQEKNHRCDLCDKCFRSSTNLRKHKQIHSNRRDFVCETCKAKFKTNGALYAHRKTHLVDKPLKCQEEGCGRQFTNNHNMKMHMKVHSSGRPYRCYLCNYGATSEFFLAAHIGSAHGDTKPYKCDICKVGFRKIHQLKQHYSTYKHSKSRLRQPPQDLEIDIKNERENIEDEPAETVSPSGGDIDVKNETENMKEQTAESLSPYRGNIGVKNETENTVEQTAESVAPSSGDFENSHDLTDTHQAVSGDSDCNFNIKTECSVEEFSNCHSSNHVFENRQNGNGLLTVIKMEPDFQTTINDTNVYVESQMQVHFVKEEMT